MSTGITRPSPSYSQSPNTGVAFDYSQYLEDIAVSLQSIASSQATLISSVDSLKTSIDTLATSSTSLKTSADNLVAPLNSLAQSVSVIANKDIIPLIDFYRENVEKGKILDNHSTDAPINVQSNSLDKVRTYITKIRNI